MEFSDNSSLSTFSLCFSGDINMKGDAKVMALIQLTSISAIFLFKLLFVCIKRRRRATTASNRLASISGEAEVDVEVP
ncbi:hypothetical protein GOBAR_AA25133 [Gossypium barbadense]|uniref:Uncharacterized protein n=2 Tax=Gossypium TaxID=3633 RepID=A0A2P5WWS9_GOSBA|nr:hypothetical protein GOBAR_AA25133 [Gossypium barbadense]TYI31135.1 hypothetical protein ES332_A05G432500v1 [Gossypium tomentosum]